MQGTARVVRRRSRPATAAVLGAALLAAAGGAAAQPAGDLVLLVDNLGKVTIDAVLISEAGERSWGANRLGNGTIEPLEQAKLRLPAGRGCFYDVRVVFHNQGTTDRLNKNLCQRANLYFAGPAIAKTALPIPVTFTNEGEIPLDQILVRPAGAKEWGKDLLGEGSLKKGETFDMRIPVGGDCQYDVAVGFRNKGIVLHLNENLCVFAAFTVSAPPTPPPEAPAGQPPQVSDSGTPGTRPAGTPPPTATGTPPSTGPGPGTGTPPLPRPGPVAGTPPSGGPGPVAGTTPPTRPPGQPAGGPRTITLLNAWRLPLVELKVRATGSGNEVGPDLLGANVTVLPGEEARVNFPQGPCRWDMLATFDWTGSAFQRPYGNVDVCGGTVRADGPTPGQALGTGTGFYVTRVGHIVTNHHVIAACGRVNLKTAQGEEIGLRVIAVDRVNDLALLQIPDTQTPTLTLRDPSVAPRLGDSLIALGYPQGSLTGDQLSVHNGILSGYKGFKGNPNDYEVNIAINSGNSGGPILDSAGLVTGVAKAGLTKAQNINFVVQVSTLLRFLRGLDVPVAIARPAEPMLLPDLIDRSTSMVHQLSCRS